MSLHAGTRRALLSTQAGGTNGLLNALIAYWPGNEANGNALDLHTNALHLTDVNTVTSNPGKVYALARQYTAANYEQHARPGDDALLSMGDVDMTIAAWVYIDSISAEMTIAGKGTPGNEYQLYYIGGGTNAFLFGVRNTANTLSKYAVATTLGLPAINIWYLVMAWHDSMADTLSISVNDGAVDSVAWAGGIRDYTNPFSIGGRSSAYWNGRIGPTMFWKSAPGGGGVLSAAQRTALYNGGAGLRYDQFKL